MYKGLIYFKKSQLLAHTNMDVCGFFLFLSYVINNFCICYIKYLLKCKSDQAAHSIEDIVITSRSHGNEHNFIPNTNFLPDHLFALLLGKIKF